MYRSLAWICLDGARAFHLGGGCGCFLVAGGTIGLRFKIRKGGDRLKGLCWNWRALVLEAFGGNLATKVYRMAG